MAKQQNFIINQSARTIAKLNKYCKIVCGMTLEEKLNQHQKEFIDKCWEQIREIEKITGKDYLEMEE